MVYLGRRQRKLGLEPWHTIALEIPKDVLVLSNGRIEFAKIKMQGNL